MSTAGRIAWHDDSAVCVKCRRHEHLSGALGTR
jgi:hypothetical protein